MMKYFKQHKYAECKWKVQTNFVHDFHIPKQEKLPMSTWVPKHSICELQLKEYVLNKCSKYPPWDSTHASTGFIIARRLRSK
jgi:hypothetical protein